MRTLILHPPLSVARDFIDYPYFADLGAVQLHAVVRAAGFDVALIDAFATPGATLRWHSDGRAHLGATVDAVLERARRLEDEGAAFDAVLVAYTPFHRPPHRDAMLAELLASLRARSPEVALLACEAYQSGQHYVEAAGERILAAYPELTGLVKYEAEVTVPELLTRLQTAGDASAVAGVFHGAAPKDLDALPLPSWDAVDLDAYARFHADVMAQLGRPRWAFPVAGRSLPLVTSRGCPFECAHCSSNPGRAAGAPKTQRRYSAARLREYLARLAAHGATHLHVLDELINVNEAHFDAFLDAAHALDLRFEVPNGMRADYLRQEHFARMRGRVTTVSVSAESGVQRVATQIVGKKLDLRHITAAAQHAHAEGVPLLVHFMIGLPAETAEEINGTLAYAFELYDRWGAEPAVQFATPLPGTALAAGRVLPVVDDWGPHFQTAPSQPDALVSADALRRFKETFDARMQAARGPDKVIMNVTYVCNNHCTFCAVGTRTQVHGHPPRQREHLLHYRERGVRMVDFDGGEPTMNPELVPLIQYARSLGYERINVTTNGRLCAYEGFAKKLVRSGLTTLLFSVHGPDPHTHAMNVGVAEAFEQTMTGLDHCVRHAPMGVTLGMNITLTKSNYERLGDVAQLAWDRGLRWLNVQFLTPFGRATAWTAPDTHDAARVTMRVIDDWKARMKVQVINLPYCFMPGYEAHLAGDVGKLSRHMIFVNNEDVNLAAYLAERRVYEDVCKSCPHAIFCGGFYKLENAPEPPWLVAETDLDRPLQLTQLKMPSPTRAE